MTHIWKGAPYENKTVDDVCFSIPSLAPSSCHPLLSKPVTKLTPKDCLRLRYNFHNLQNIQHRQNPNLRLRKIQRRRIHSPLSLPPGHILPLRSIRPRRSSFIPGNLLFPQLHPLSPRPHPPRSRRRRHRNALLRARKRLNPPSLSLRTRTRCASLEKDVDRAKWV